MPFHFPEVLEDSLGRREEREMWRVGGQWRGEGRGEERWGEGGTCYCMDAAGRGTRGRISTRDLKHQS